jgi:ADP-ribosyl-[dinitrogen reductase] hydrolase
MHTQNRCRGALIGLAAGDAVGTTLEFSAVARGGYKRANREEVRDTGYVVDSLEAALWCFHRHDTFAGAVLEAANLGDDADTTAAVVGQLAGSFHGEAGIPAPWLARIHLGHEIAALADSLLERNLSPE